MLHYFRTDNQIKKIRPEWKLICLDVANDNMLVFDRFMRGGNAVHIKSQFFQCFEHMRRIATDIKYPAAFRKPHIQYFVYYPIVPVLVDPEIFKFPPFFN